MNWRVAAVALVAVLWLACAIATGQQSAPLSSVSTPVSAPATATAGGTLTVPTITAPATEAPEGITEQRAIEIAEAIPAIRDWNQGRELTRVVGELDEKTGVWTVFFISKRDGVNEYTESQALIANATGNVNEVRTGPQVAWMMARGYDGAFGRAITRPAIWIPLCIIFLAALLPLHRPRQLLAWRTVDLLVLLSFVVSLEWFNRGEIFTSVPLAYPPMVYLMARLGWIGLRRARRVHPPTDAPEGAPVAPTPPPGPAGPRFPGWMPTWLMGTLIGICAALRYGLNAFDSNVIDVGYAGVIGADRIMAGQTPYGTFPSDCGNCDTYGPLNYIVYVPFELFQPWTGRWDGLPAAHGAAVMFDLLCLVGMMALGWRLAGLRMATAFGLAWMAFPFTAYALATNANDSLVAAMLIWGMVFIHRPLVRGLFLGLALATKFAPAILLLLWSRRPFPRPTPRRQALPYVAGLALAGVAVGWVLLLDGWDGVRAFPSRTLGYQMERESPFSIWGQYPDELAWLQLAVTGAVALAGAAVLLRPRRLDVVTVAALSGALLIGMQLTVEHWFYLYIPWFLPFALLVFVPIWPAPRPMPVAAASPPAPLPAAGSDGERHSIPAVADGGAA